MARKHIKLAKQARLELEGYFQTSWTDQIQHKFLQKARNHLDKAIKHASKAKFGNISPLAEAYRLRSMIPAHSFKYQDSLFGEEHYSIATFDSTSQDDEQKERMALEAKPSLKRVITQKDSEEAVRKLIGGKYNSKELDVLVNRIACDSHFKKVLPFLGDDLGDGYQSKQIASNLENGYITMKEQLL